MARQIEITNNESVNHISRINEGIMKSFDNIMFQQTKMDNKAYIFIGFFSVILGIINRNGIINQPINFIFGITVFFLFLSLLPITNKNFTKVLETIINKQSNNKHNIFYYNDLYCLNLDKYKEILKREYQLAYYTKFELNLMEQTLINARILSIKVFLHNIAYLVLFISILIYCIYLFCMSIFLQLK